MSWGEVFKINNNMKKSINEQLRDMKFQPIRIITTDGTFTPEKTGLYKVICVGKGGTAIATDNDVDGGGGGGVAIKTLRLVSTTSYNVTASSTTASFSDGTNALTATAGGNGTTATSTSGLGGTASGGEFNFTGGNGEKRSVDNTLSLGGSVGVFLSELSMPKSIAVQGVDGVYEMPYGNSILGYGGGGSGYYNKVSSSSSKGIATQGLPAAVIIVPIEMEE